LYEFLTTKALNGYSDNSVKWNFQKYLINEEGKLVEVIAPTTKPMDPVILAWLRSVK
jgi:glutathione peroxidase